MKLSMFINLWLIPFYGLLGSAYRTFGVLGESGLEDFLLITSVAWAMIVLPVNAILLYPVLGLAYYFIKAPQVRISLCAIASFASIYAGLFSFDAIMSV